MRILLTCLMLMAQPVFAGDTRVIAGDLMISDPVLVKAFSKARAAGGYMTIANVGETDTLIGARAMPYMAMIHESRDDGGVAKMVHLDAVEVPGGGELVFAQGGLHVMVMGLQPGDLEVGGTLEIVLEFDRAGEVPVMFEVVDSKDAMLN
jgi:copper(I)-binding protein